MANCATLQRQLLHSQTCLGGEGEAAHQGSCHVDAGCSRVRAVHPRGLWEAEEAIRVLHVELGGTYATGVLGVDECELCEAGVGVAPRGSTRLRLEVHTRSRQPFGA